MSPPAATPSPNRIFYIDALRAFAMLYGILNHAINIWRSAPGGGPWLISEVNDIFRQATFFFVSGFFMLMAYWKVPLREFYRTRFDLLIVPLVVSLVALAPVTNWLVFRFHNGPIGLQDYLFGGGWRRPSIGENVWHLHWWFLFSFSAFALLMPIFARLVASGPVAHAVAAMERSLGRFTLWAMVLVLAFLEVLLVGSHKLLFEPLVIDTPFAWIVRASFSYLPCFLVGILCYAYPGLFQHMHRFSVAGLLLFGTIYYGVNIIKEDLSFAVWGIINHLSRMGLVIMTIAALLWIFRRYLSRPGTLLSTLTASAYTFYLIHYTVIYLLANAKLPITENRWVIYLVILAVGTPLCILFHTRVVEPTPLLRYLMNGRRTVPRPAPASS